MIAMASLVQLKVRCSVPESYSENLWQFWWKASMCGASRSMTIQNNNYYAVAQLDASRSQQLLYVRWLEEASPIVKFRLG